MDTWELMKQIREYKNNTFYSQVDVGLLKALRHVINLKDQKIVDVFEQMLCKYFSENLPEFKNFINYKKEMNKK